MNDRVARRLSWGATLLCGHYIIWGSYEVFRHQVPELAQLIFAGSGMRPPVAAILAITISNYYTWWVGCVLLLFLSGKELLLRDTAIRLVITFAVLLGAAWTFELAVSSMLSESALMHVRD